MWVLTLSPGPETWATCEVMGSRCAHQYTREFTPIIMSACEFPSIKSRQSPVALPGTPTADRRVCSAWVCWILCAPSPITRCA